VEVFLRHLLNFHQTIVGGVEYGTFQPQCQTIVKVQLIWDAPQAAHGKAVMQHRAIPV
jgi:hypothetical protein